MDETGYIHTWMESSLNFLKKNQVPEVLNYRISAEIMENHIIYDVGVADDAIFKLELKALENSGKSNKNFQYRDSLWLRHAKMFTVCEKYLDCFGDNSPDERLFADEWRKLERELVLDEIASHKIANRMAARGQKKKKEAIYQVVKAMVHENPKLY